jgi:hypothetical protein
VSSRWKGYSFTMRADGGYEPIQEDTDQPKDDLEYQAQTRSLDETSITWSYCEQWTHPLQLLRSLHLELPALNFLRVHTHHVLAGRRSSLMLRLISRTLLHVNFPLSGRFLPDLLDHYRMWSRNQL